MTRSRTREDEGDVLARLEGDDCPLCAGTLERGSFNGTVAIVCDRCGAPAVRLWSVRSTDDAR